jgi:type IX secretion system PorP/SprF family membrane protein
MKKIFVWIAAIVGASTSFAQQRPHYTQYILNQYIINPALTGIENYTDVRVSHRHQWAGFQDAPVTTYVTAHTALGKKDFRTTATSFSMEGENPRGQSYWEQYTAAKPHHGIGLQVINDRTGPLNHFAAYATYAYHIGLTPQTSLSAGFGIGMARLGLDASKLDITNVDPAVASSGQLGRWRPDLNVGVYLYSADYFLGLSALQVIPQRIDFSNNAVVAREGKQVPHLFATAGYRFLLTEDINLIPSLMVKYVNPVPVQVELNAKMQYRDFLWLGATYRKDDGFAGMAGINISNRVMAGYAYDYTTSRLNNFSRGTHELLIGFLLGNTYGDTCPRNVW